MAVIYVRTQPLVGGPSVLPLHVVVQVHSTDFDFLPLEPTAVATTLALLRGGTVPARTRVRSVADWQAPRGRAIGYTSRAAEELRTFAALWPQKLALGRADCWTFAAALFDFACDYS